MGADLDDDFSDTEAVEILEPPPPPPINLKAQTDAAVAAHQEDAMANGLEGEEPIKKKKKKNKKKKNKNTQPSGFEDFYVEAPISPEQAAELNQLYSLKKPFAERIELCIQRYRAKRRWDPDRLKFFDRYLVLGGIRTGQKAYGGGVSTEARGEDGEEPDASDIQAQTATDYVEHYHTSNRNQDNWKGTPGVFDDDDEEWWVDFEHVVKAFLSHVVLQVFCLHTEEDLLVAIKTIRNFLNYVVFHNVAPEYRNNLIAALSICNLSEKELLFCNAALSKLPGRFNACCSTLFGGHYHGLYEADQASTWEGKQATQCSLGIPRGEAEAYYLQCIAKIGTKEQIDAGVKGVTLVSKDLIGFEILDLNFPRGSVKELGYLEVKAWVYEGERMPKHGLPDKWRLWVEKELGMYLFKEMKVEGLVYTLSNGLRYINTVTAICPSYYTYLEPPNQTDTNDDVNGE